MREQCRSEFHLAANPVNQLAVDALRGRATRRDILRRSGALGLTAPLVASILALRAGGVRAQDATPAAGGAPGYSAVAPSWLRTDLAGQSVSVVLGSDGPATPWEEAVVALFTEATGIQVTRIAGAEQATDRLTNYQQLLGAGASDVDAMMIDVIWPGILAPHAVDLTEAMVANDADYIPAIVENNTVDGLLVGIPWFTDGGHLYYRTDLLEKYGFSAPPATWTELEQMATAIQDGERATNPDFQGFVWQGNAYEGLTCDALEWQYSHGGGRIIEPDGTVTVNNPQTVAAFERAKGWIGTISPEGVTTYDEEGARGVWQAGNAAFMRNWSYAHSLGEAEDSAIKGKFEHVVLPRGDGEGAVNASTVGGWQMMVTKYSESPEAAIEFCRFLTSKELQKSHAIERSQPPTIASVYADPDVVAANSFYPVLQEILASAVVRPSTVTSDLYNEVSVAYFTAVNQILTGQADAASAVTDLASKIEGIMADL